jgi:hypothetical protein
MPTLSKDERDRLSLAIRTIWDTLRHVDMPQGEHEALEMAGNDMLALLLEAQATDETEATE